jgi:hypothetical protein
LRIAGARNGSDGRIDSMLAAMRGRDECPAAGAREHDVARLIANEQRPCYSRRT